MSDILGDIARYLRYRPLTALLGQAQQISGLNTLEKDLAALLKPVVPGEFRLADPEDLQRRRKILAQYGVINLTFFLDGMIWGRQDTVVIPILQEYGFLSEPTKSKDSVVELASDRDPDCLRELLADIERGEAMLLLLLEEHPRRQMTDEMWTMLEDGDSVKFLEAALRDYFPRKLIVKDACLTNARFIWQHKHIHV